ncbi:MAG: hypothetical protein J5529_10000 [Prevotella sp.]|nr:hypothetical protein [Prevotella sp.]
MAKSKKKKPQQEFLSPERFMRERVRSLQLGPCYFPTEMDERGEGIAIVSRVHTGGRVSFAVYLIDSWCTGVKDTYFRLRMEEDEFQSYVERMGDHVRPASYNEVHNLIYGALEFAEEAGIPPHKDFAVTKYMLEEDTDDIPLIEYSYGKDGKHFLVVTGKLEASRYLQFMRRHLKEGEYDYIIALDPDEMDFSPEEDE